MYTLWDPNVTYYYCYCYCYTAGTPGLDWRDLSAAAQGALEAARRFECIAFVDNDDTDTQCAVWRDADNKRLILSFRGTSHWKDVLTGSCSTVV
jgi:hypothetical protein